MAGEQYQAWPGAIPVRRICGYEDEEPIWGEVVGIYHPFRSEVVPVNSVKRSETLEYLRQKQIVFEKHEQIIIPDITLDGGEKTEVYFQTNFSCNLRCAAGGCVADGKLIPFESLRTMEPEFAQSLMHRTIDSARELGFKTIKIKYAGGEVTMPQPLKLILELQKTIEEEKAIGGINIEQVVITNGTYLQDPKVIEALRRIGAPVTVSIWGWGEENDRLRGVRREVDKFPNVLKGLENLKESGLDFNLALIVHPDTAHQLPEIIEKVWNRKDPLLMGIDLWRPMNRKDAEMMVQVGYKKVVSGLRLGLAKILDLIDQGVSVRPLDKLDFLTPYSLKATTCGTGFNYLAVGVTGLAACHGRLNPPFREWPNVKPQDNLFRLASSEWDNNWQDLVAKNMDWGEMNLAMRLALSWHGGSGCPWQAHLEKGEFGFPAQVAEQIYAPLFEELLAVEMYRRAKTGESSPDL
jgi:hypothetical protein